MMTSQIGRVYGWNRDRLDGRDYTFAVAAPKALPSKLHLPMPEPLDQQDLGSCVLNAGSVAVDYERIRQGLSPWCPSRLFWYYNVRVMERTVLSDAGVQIRDAIKSLAQMGVCSEDEQIALTGSVWPYDIVKFAIKPPVACYADANTVEALQYGKVAPTLLQLKNTLAAKHPILVGIEIYESFESAAVARTGIVPMPDVTTEQSLGGHGVLLTGYDDDTQRWRLQNSWGANWGQEGSFELPYSYLLDRTLGSDYWAIKMVGQ